MVNEENYEEEDEDIEYYDSTFKKGFPIVSIVVGLIILALAIILILRVLSNIDSDMDYKIIDNTLPIMIEDTPVNAVDSYENVTNITEEIIPSESNENDSTINMTYSDGNITYIINESGDVNMTIENG